MRLESTSERTTAGIFGSASRPRIKCSRLPTCLRRDLSVGPGNFVTPTYLAEQAREIAQKYGLEITVWGKDELRAHGMNAILAVNQGSSQPPAFVALKYVAPG